MQEEPVGSPPEVGLDLPDGCREFTTPDVIEVDDQGRIVELLAFPDGAADPFESPAVRTDRAG